MFASLSVLAGTASFLSFMDYCGTRNLVASKNIEIDGTPFNGDIPAVKQDEKMTKPGFSIYDTKFGRVGVDSQIMVLDNCDPKTGQGFLFGNLIDISRSEHPSCQWILKPNRFGLALVAQQPTNLLHRDPILNQAIEVEEKKRLKQTAFWGGTSLALGLISYGLKELKH